MPQTIAAANTHRVNALVDGELVNATLIRFNPSAFQDVLLSAKARYGSAICQCTEFPLQLVIRERANKLFLACWPDQAQAHALDCPFYHQASDSAVKSYTSDAISEDGPNTILKLHHPLVQINATPPQEKKRAHGPSAVHIWGLLHHLWNSGGLNRWHPGWSRDWGLVRSMVRRVAQATTVDHSPLLPSLYVPPIWIENRKKDIDEDWRLFTAPLYRQHRSTASVSSGFVIGVVRKLELTPYGYSLRLQHHAAVFYVDKVTADRLANYSRRGWAAIKMMEGARTGDPKTKVVAAMRIQSTSSHRLVVVEGALMRVSTKFVPVASSYEERLAELLISENRAFIKPLHYDMHNEDFAHFVLNDCAGSNTLQTERCKFALFVYGAKIAATQQVRLERKDRALAHQLGIGYWKWDAAIDIDIPALPPLVN